MEIGGLFPMVYLVWRFDLTIISIPNVHLLIIRFIQIQPCHAWRLMVKTNCKNIISDIIVSLVKMLSFQLILIVFNINVVEIKEMIYGIDQHYKILCYLSLLSVLQKDDEPKNQQVKMFLLIFCWNLWEHCIISSPSFLLLM